MCYKDEWHESSADNVEEDPEPSEDEVRIVLIFT